MRRPSVLIVEDEFLVALDLECTLAAAGYAVAAVCRSGEEAVARTAAARPDLVLMDMRLAGELDGLAAARALRRHHPGLPVLFHSAYGEAELHARIAALPATRFLAKPSSASALLDAAARLLGGEEPASPAPRGACAGG